MVCVSPPCSNVPLGKISIMRTLDDKEHIYLHSMKTKYYDAQKRMKMFRIRIQDKLLPYVYSRWLVNATLSVSLIIRIYLIQTHYWIFNFYYVLFGVVAIHLFVRPNSKKMVSEENSSFVTALGEFEVWAVTLLDTLIIFQTTFDEAHTLSIEIGLPALCLCCTLLIFLEQIIMLATVGYTNHTLASKSKKNDGNKEMMNL